MHKDKGTSRQVKKHFDQECITASEMVDDWREQMISR